MSTKNDGATCARADTAYFEKRGLFRHAGGWSLWALGAGAAISADFLGWNFGLGVGGFGGLAIATLIIATLYVGMGYSIAEMSPATHKPVARRRIRGRTSL